MINVIITDEIVEISGHAGYAEAGQDIVCAAVSALGDTAASLLWDEPDARDGYLLLRYRRSDRDELAYINFLVSGLGLIMDTYPSRINIEDYRAH